MHQTAVNGLPPVPPALLSNGQHVRNSWSSPIYLINWVQGAGFCAWDQSKCQKYCVHKEAAFQFSV